MRKMKKILAWLTVLTVNVSMMPMPTVAAATATDASTALNEETITSDATKEATQAQETAKKAVESATKAAATTAAKKVTTETKKAGSKSKSALQHRVYRIRLKKESSKIVIKQRLMYLIMMHLKQK